MGGGQTRPWCLSVSIQTHEVGHNFNLYHSGVGGDEYADRSGVMGYSTASLDAPQSCFNAAKEAQLGWFSDQEQYLTDLRSTGRYRSQMIASASIGRFEGDTTKDILVRIPNSRGSDYFLSYNRAVGANVGTPVGIDQIEVIQSEFRATSNRVATISRGQIWEVSYPNTSTSLKVRFTRSENNDEVATVDFFFDSSECDIQNCGFAPTPNPTPPPPTPNPTPLSTPFPTQPIPTAPPTPGPTFDPATSLVLLDTSFTSGSSGFAFRFDQFRVSAMKLQW